MSTNDFKYSLHLKARGKARATYRGVLNSAGLGSVEIKFHYLVKQLATKENAHHLAYDYSHYTVKIVIR